MFKLWTNKAQFALPVGEWWEYKSLSESWCIKILGKFAHHQAVAFVAIDMWDHRHTMQFTGPMLHWVLAAAQCTVITPACLCVCDNSKLHASILTKLDLWTKVVAISSWLNFGRQVPLERGSAAEWKFLAPPYYSQSAVFASLWVFFFHVRFWSLWLVCGQWPETWKLVGWCLMALSAHRATGIWSTQ